MLAFNYFSLIMFVIVRKCGMKKKILAFNLFVVELEYFQKEPQCPVQIEMWIEKYKKHF